MEIGQTPRYLFYYKFTACFFPLFFYLYLTYTRSSVCLCMTTMYYSVKLHLLHSGCVANIHIVFPQKMHCENPPICQITRTILFRFTHFMEEMCKLPSAVGEGRTFNITESTSEVVFNSDAKVIGRFWPSLFFLLIQIST